MKNWKIPAGCAVGAFVIAMIVGLLGRVPFGTLLLRAGISGLVFSGVMYGLLYAVKSKLPELYSLLVMSESEGEEQEGVDIVISDDDEDSDSSPLFSQFDESGKAEISESDSFAEEVNELSGDEKEKEIVGELGEEEEEKLGELESAEEFEAESQESGDSEEEFDRFGKTEELSDISGKEAEVVEVLGEFKDPQEVARAVQTMMKRDEE